jgi:hypothetical protein
MEDGAIQMTAAMSQDRVAADVTVDTGVAHRFVKGKLPRLFYLENVERLEEDETYGVWHLGAMGGAQMLCLKCRFEGWTNVDQSESRKPFCRKSTASSIGDSILMRCRAGDMRLKF